MTINSRFLNRLATWVTVGCVVLLLLAAGMWWVTSGSPGTRLTAYFSRTVGLYEGSSVRVLGVPSGEITDVTPKGGKVRVDMVVDSDVEVPADAGAVVIAPSLVSDRYVQLTPAYDGGQTMESGAEIPLDRTATPAGIDRLYESLNEVAKSLGPKGANDQGTLSELLDTAAASLDGNGKNLNKTVSDLADLSQTLENSKGDMFATVSNLQKFTHTLAESDQQLDEFFGRVADVSDFLAEDSDQMGAALSSLASALGDVREFVENNSEQLSTDVDRLASITGVLAKQRSSLAEALDVMPVAVTNFLHTYDAHTGTTMVRYNANELTFPPGEMLCRLGSQLTPERLPDLIGKTCDALGSATEGLPDLPSISQVLNTLQTGNLPPLPLPGVDDANKALPGTKDAEQSSSTGKEADKSSSADKEGGQ